MPGVPIHLGDMPRDPILLGPMPGDPIILGNPANIGPIPSIILGLTSAGLTMFCLGPESTPALGDALPLLGATCGPFPLTTCIGPGDALFLAVGPPPAPAFS